MNKHYQDHEVFLGEKSYKIFFGKNILENSNSIFKDYVFSKKIIVIYDSSLEHNHLPRLMNSLNNFNVNLIKVKNGEKSKSFDSLKLLLNQILSLGVTRETILIAFGGGVIGDLVGFAASVLLRGLKYIQIPSTLLAQVDSSVGGKTGINTKHGKNLVGSFCQPLFVLSDFNLLNTLNNRELLAGYSEIVKYGLIIDSNFFNWLDKNWQNIIKKNETHRAEAIIKSCKIKSKIVEEDEFENGKRAILNLGHTFAHAFEALSKYNGSLLHGEAVALGMVQAFKLSWSLGLCKYSEFIKVKTHIENIGLPSTIDSLPIRISSSKKLWQVMQNDKKNKNGNVNFILPKSIGKVVIYDEVNYRDLDIIFEENK